MSTILDQIVATKRKEVERLKLEVPLSRLEAQIKEQPPPLNFGGALWGTSVRLIAEVKRASPSRGLLRADFDYIALATTYADNGAAAISVLTEVNHFQGSIKHLAAVKEAVRSKGVPVLRKDFVFDPYQVCEARAYGADAFLLIVSILTPDLLRELLALGRECWMQALVEVHDEKELEVALEAGAEVIGINNRNLRTFVSDLSVSERLAPLVPKDKVIVSESGINSREDVLRLKKVEINAILVGEALVTAKDVAAKVRELSS
ncbi:MAG: indole-3-glycerol phosphate synthase TrpC [Chloroflexi bacterium]|nr:indole-3-glycerol phosphate synthase TrpC [Chloroflexota bacterium]